MVSSVVSLSSPLLSSSLKRTTASRRRTPTKRRFVGGCSLSSSSSSSSSSLRVKAFVAKTTTLTILYLTVTGGFVPTTTDFAMAMGGDDGTRTTTTLRTENASSSSVFNGKYSDPNHPGCLRGIERVRSTTKAKVFGEDGTPGCQADGRETKKWELEGELRGENEILIDFSKKGGPKNLLGKWTGSGVLFPDGNTWSKL